MGEEESANTVCQWSVILSNKTLCINFLVVFSILAIDVIPTKMPTVLWKRHIPLKTFFMRIFGKKQKKKLEEKEFRVVEVRECEWLKIRKQSEVSCFLKTLTSVTPKRKLCFEKMVEGIQNKALYGFLVVEIHTPNELKEKFKDFPLIIKNSFISGEDIGAYMQNVAEEHGIFKKQQKYLISSYFAEKFIINSEMVKFYLEMGLKITKIKEFIKFFSTKMFCFSGTRNCKLQKIIRHG